MKHTNSNAIAATLRGIAEGELAADDTNADHRLALAYRDHDLLSEQLERQRTGRFVLAMEVAYLQGFIAGLRGSTEFATA